MAHFNAVAPYQTSLGRVTVTQPGYPIMECDVVIIAKQEMVSSAIGPVGNLGCCIFVAFLLENSAQWHTEGGVRGLEPPPLAWKLEIFG